MRTVNYRTHWSYLGPAVKRQELLVDFVLDVLYLMDMNGVIPPLTVLNEVLRGGGSSGGMEPGTTWRRFQISQAEYEELVSALLSLDVTKAKKKHPYVQFERVIVDKQLDDCGNYAEWIEKVSQKYRIDQGN